MQQFRPLPRFDKVEEARPVEVPPLDTQPVVTTGVFPAVAPHTTGRIPVLLLTGPHPTPVTDQLTALAKKPASSGSQPTLSSALQSTMGVTGPARRTVVIPVDGKRRKRTAAPAKSLKPRVRHTLVILATLVIAIGTLATLVPLSSGQGGSNLFNSFGNWIHSAQMDAQIQAHMNMSMGVSQPFNPNPVNLPPMHIPNSPYVAIAQQDATNAGIPPVYFVRQINQESGFNPSAVSVTDAEGIAQFEPGTAAGLGIDPFDPVQALRAAAQLMSRYNSLYGDYAKALGAYNAGSGTVQGAVNACGVNWLSCMPAQTQNYVYVIMGI
jgi:hypothetical protein